MLFLELNLYGNVPENIKTNNYTIRNDVATDEAQVIVPENGLFLELNHEVIHMDTGDVLVENVDYYLTYKSIYAETTYGISAYGGVVITNKDLTGSVILTVHHVGSGFSVYNTTLIRDVLELVDGVPIDVEWGEVDGVPDSVRPNSHSLRAENIAVGYNDMVSMLNQMAIALTKASEKWDSTKIPIGAKITLLNPSTTINLDYWVQLDGSVINKDDYIALFLIMGISGDTFTLPTEANTYVRTN